MSTYCTGVQYVYIEVPKNLIKCTVSTSPFLMIKNKNKNKKNLTIRIGHSLFSVSRESLFFEKNRAICSFALFWIDSFFCSYCKEWRVNRSWSLFLQRAKQCITLGCSKTQRGNCYWSLFLQRAKLVFAFLQRAKEQITLGNSFCKEWKNEALSVAFFANSPRLKSPWLLFLQRANHSLSLFMQRENKQIALNCFFCTEQKSKLLSFALFAKS